MDKKEKVITPTQLLEMRTQLINRYGEKIINGPSDNMTTEEKVACVTYRTMSDELHKMAPNTKNLDRVYDFYVRQGVNSAFGLIVKYATKVFWVVMVIAVMLVLFKFLLS